MCGIVGTLNLTSKAPIELGQLQAMLGAIRHRGPDQFGIYTYQDEHSGIGLGNARLSIIDLTGGQQPISNEDGSIWIVFNGEIFNYVELQSKLKKLGHRLTTHSDTEVIIHLYEEYGPACIEHLNGQFVFALWDERKRSLFIARDRMGIRPLYYTVKDGALIFASEIKALLTDNRVEAVLNPIALDQIFTYWSPLSPHTAFQEIFTLPPGSFLIAPQNNDIQIKPYWQPAFPTSNLKPSFADIETAAQQLRHLLIDATKIRLRADVPVGAYLSGGLDSSAITALIHHYTGNQLETFSISFDDNEFDESSFQTQMAAHLGTHHHIIRCTSQEIGNIFPDVIWHTETPLMRTSPAPLFLLSRLVQDHGFKVVLTGEGADEFLAGYNIFKEAKIRHFWARQPDSQWRPALLARLYPYIEDLSHGGSAYLHKFFGQGLADTDSPDYSHAIRWRNTSRSKRFFSPELTSAIPQTSHPLLPPDFSDWSPLSRAQYLEITVFMSEYLLSSQGDRMAMAHSIEGRFPFLDHRVVSFANQLPPHFKMLGLDEKHILKRAVREFLPDSIWNRPKRPYRAPIYHAFFQKGTLVDWAAELLSPSQIEASGYFNSKSIDNLQKKLKRFNKLGETDSMALVGLISTQLIHQQFIADFRPSPPINDQDDIKLVRKT